ncbi:hypothetical protein DFH07DRAFT_763876 [Mycena maculata]|uniref:Uncharacterized protein n=1 Tax=Mycena maculata TaxID=230809 RepID=A0AAD7P2J0_9AGAR|nr:hypothetical protein DFH07DRAFT_763876 [Mycena maculata]
MVFKSPGQPHALWDPCLRPYPKDEEVWQSEPIKTFFSELHSSKIRTRSSHENWDVLRSELLGDEAVGDEWAEFALDYLVFCLGGGILAKNAAEALDLTWTVIFDVLFLRYVHQGSVNGEELALKRLLEAQRAKNFAAFNDPPAEFCWAEDLEQRNTYAVDLDPGDHESDWEDALQHEDDRMTGLPQEDLDYPPIHNFIQSTTLQCSAVIPKALPRDSSNRVLDCSELPDRWIRNINVFFWPLVNPLARRNVELSFRFHNWKVSYAEKICDWTPEVLTEAEYEARIFGWNSEIVFRTLKRLELFTNANAPNSKETWAHRQILKRVKRHAWRPQWSSPANDSEPPSSSTATASTSTVKPSLSMTSAARHHRKQREDNRRVRTNEAREEERGERQLKDLQELAERGTELELDRLEQLQLCPLCKDLNMDKHCIRTVEVKRQPNAKQFIGAAFTCAPVGDQLKPVPVRRRKTSKGPIKKMPPLRYINPESLGMQWIKPRPEVQKRYQRDITRLFWYPEGVEAVLVGGVRYEAFEPTILQRLIDNHRRVKVRSIHCRGILHCWNYGKMTGRGTHQPDGGIRGDGYAPYADHSGDTIEDIKALFREAVMNSPLLYFRALELS